MDWTNEQQNKKYLFAQFPIQTRTAVRILILHPSISILDRQRTRLRDKPLGGWGAIWVARNLPNRNACACLWPKRPPQRAAPSFKWIVSDPFRLFPAVSFGFVEKTVVLVAAICLILENQNPVVLQPRAAGFQSEVPSGDHQQCRPSTNPALPSTAHPAVANYQILPQRCRAMSSCAAGAYYVQLKWCTGDDGRLRRDRLQRVAQAMRYSPKWIKLNADEYFVDIWEGVRLWHKEQKAKKKREAQT